MRLFVDVRNLVGVRPTYASFAIRRPRARRNRQIGQPLARRAEGIAWQIIHDRLGRHGSRCNRRLALFYRASGLVYCKLVSRVSAAVDLSSPALGASHNALHEGLWCLVEGQIPARFQHATNIPTVTPIFCVFSVQWYLSRTHQLAVI